MRAKVLLPRLPTHTRNVSWGISYWINSQYSSGPEYKSECVALPVGRTTTLLPKRSIPYEGEENFNKRPRSVNRKNMKIIWFMWLRDFHMPIREITRVDYGYRTCLNRKRSRRLSRKIKGSRHTLPREIKSPSMQDRQWGTGQRFFKRNMCVEKFK